MKKVLAIGFALAALVTLVKCGSKSSDEGSGEATKPVATLSVTCSGKACVGTEGQ